MANTVAPAGKNAPKAGAGGTGALSPQMQQQLALAAQQITAKSIQDNQIMLIQSQQAVDQITGGLGKNGGPTGLENLAANMLGPVNGGGPNAGLGTPGLGLDPTGGLGTPGLGAGLDPTGGLGTAGGPGAIPGLGGTATAPLGGLSNNLGLGGLGADPTGLGAGNLTNPLAGLMGGPIA